MDYERIGAFTQRLQMEFPHAQILTKNTPPDPSIFGEEGQYIQISNVRPIPNQPLFKNTMFPVPGVLLISDHCFFGILLVIYFQNN